MITAVTSTKIFCVKGCPAKAPLQKNVRKYTTAREAIAAGFRPCKRCRPLSHKTDRPEWLDGLLKFIEDRDSEIPNAKFAHHGFDPGVIRNWFNQHHQITLQAYVRLRRLAGVLGIRQIDTSNPQLTKTFSRLKDPLAELFGLGTHTEAKPILVNRIATRLGPMMIAAADEGVALLEFAERRMLKTQMQRVARLFHRPLVPGQHPNMVVAHQQLEEYLSGKRSSFEVPLMKGGTPFQQNVWSELQLIPSGTTTTYARLSKRIGTKSARAIGRANGDNRLAILIPCHRVIASDGKLAGYGGGLWRKAWLLEHESSKS